MLTRQQQLQFCKVCKNKAFSAQLGIICKLTGERADFVEVCENYELDEVEQKKVDDKNEYQTRIKPDFTFGLDNFGVNSGITAGLIIVGIGFVYMFVYLVNGFLNFYALVIISAGLINIIISAINNYRRKRRTNLKNPIISNEILD